MTYRELFDKAKRLVDAGEITIGEYEEMTKPLDRDVKHLDKIKAEINGMYRVILKGTPKDDWAVRWNDCLDDVLQIIDKYKGSEG